MKAYDLRLIKRIEVDSVVDGGDFNRPYIAVKSITATKTRISTKLEIDADVQRIARQLEPAPGYPPKVQMTALAGFIPFHIGDLKSTIEVVRRIPGISDAHTSAIQADWNEITIRFLDPISLLGLQIGTDGNIVSKKRQDVVHMKMLLPCVRELSFFVNHTPRAKS